MIADIKKRLDEIHNLPLAESCKQVLSVSSDVITLLERNPTLENSELGKLVMDKLHGVRYLISANKAFDRVDFDVELKKAWESLNRLVN